MAISLEGWLEPPHTADVELLVDLALSTWADSGPLLTRTQILPFPTQTPSLCWYSLLNLRVVGFWGVGHLPSFSAKHHTPDGIIISASSPDTKDHGIAVAFRPFVHGFLEPVVGYCAMQDAGALRVG